MNQSEELIRGIKAMLDSEDKTAKLKYMDHLLEMVCLILEKKN